MASRVFLRPRLPRAIPSFRRYKHHLPPLSPEFAEHGIDELYSPEGFGFAWHGYQTMVIDKLNALTSVLDSDYNSDVKTILLKYAREPSMASTFNHASMAHNNHFYFKCLTNDKSRQKMDPVLKKNLERSFNSIETLRAEMLATANAMFGPGFVWLVQNQTNKANFHILTTYIAGSPYPGAHWRAQPHDLNTGLHIPGHERQDTINGMGSPNNNVGAHGSHSEAGKDERKYAPGGVNIKPLLCVNTWEHAYMRDWGLDKRGFLQAWWKRIDWTTVAGEADLSSGNTSKFQMGA